MSAVPMSSNSCSSLSASRCEKSLLLLSSSRLPLRSLLDVYISGCGSAENEFGVDCRETSLLRCTRSTLEPVGDVSREWLGGGRKEEERTEARGMESGGSFLGIHAAAIVFAVGDGTCVWCREKAGRAPDVSACDSRWRGSTANRQCQDGLRDSLSWVHYRTCISM